MAASIFEPVETGEPGQPVGDWRPTRYTPPLTGTEDFDSEAPKLLRFIKRHWSIPETPKLELDPWQPWLIRHVLERYPADWPVPHLRGQLRFRQVVISMGRQNGKSLVAAILAIYLLVLHMRGPRVIGLASVDRQAQIVYQRVKYAIDKSDALTSELKTTNTRGITRRDGSGIYQTLPAVEDSAQGEPASGVLYDELHLGLAALWDAMVLAMRARKNGLLIGFTTAGDDGSDLLIRLYREGQSAIDGDDERFGFFCWEGADDDLTQENVIAANPAVACGRIPLDLAMAEAAKMYADQTKGPDGLTGRQRAIRYTLNRFIEGAADAWASTTAWKGSTVADVDLDALEDGQAHPMLVYGLGRTLDWSAATITATTYQAGVTRTHLVAQLINPSQDTLHEACRRLARRGRRVVFAMDARDLGNLAKNLKADGYETWNLGDLEMHAAAQHAAAQIGKRAVRHPGDVVTTHQMARGRRRVTGDSWRLSSALSLGDIDAVKGLVVSAYVAHTLPEPSMQLF